MGDEERHLREGPAEDRAEGPDGGVTGEADGEARIGPVLEQARLRRGLSLEEVEQATKIRKRYLLGLEKQDYGSLPDTVYVHGFLKTYANYLGLDGEDLGRQFKSSRRSRRDRQINYDPPESDFGRPVIHPGGLSGTRRRGLPLAAILTALAAVLILAAVLGVLYWMGVRQTDEAPADNPPAAEEPAQQAAPEDPNEEPPGTPNETPPEDEPEGDGRDERRGEEADPEGPEAASPESVDVVVRVEDQESWLSVRADGVVVYEAVAQPGFEQVFTGEEVVGVRSGNAGAIRVEVNGQDYGPLGGSGEVVDRDFTLLDEG